MALNPTFASASVNPSQSIGSDASASQQGALPTGMPQNTGFAGLGGLDINYTAPKEPLVPTIPNFNQSYYQSPQYQSYLNNMPQYGTDDMRMMPFGGYGSSNIANLQNQSYEDFLKNPSMGQQPNIQEEFGVPSPFMNQGAMPDNQGAMLSDATRRELNPNYVAPNYTAQDVQTAMQNPEFDSNYYKNANVLDAQGNPLSMDAKQQLIQPFYNQQQQPNYALQPPTEFVGQLPQQSLQQDPPSRYTYFGNDKTDYSQLGLSQTALDSLKMMSGMQDSGQFYYDTQTKTFNQGAGRPGPNIPGQRQRVGMSNIPLELMNKLGTSEQIDFSPYVQYTDGPPLPPQIGDQPLPEQQPQVLGPQVPYEDPRATIGPTFTQRNPLTPTATPTGTTPMATNPLSTYATTPTTGSTPAPTLNATPGSASSGSFGQGGVLPNVTTTQQQVTAAPSFYTDYLNQLATQGGQAAQNAQYVGAQPLQEQAFNLASQNVGNYQPTLQNAINLASSVGNTNLAQAIGDVGQANIARNLAPQATAGIVGSGQFGSKRGAQALGDVIANAELGLTAQQQQAMQQDMANRIAAAQQLGTLANSTQQLGLGDVNALSTLGQQQQTIAQNQQLFPMQQLANQSALLRGYTIPTSVSASQTGPGQQGQFQTSPLQQIMSVGTLLGALAKPDASGNSAGGNLVGGLGNIINKISGKFAGSTGSSGSSSSVSPVTGLPIGIPGGSTYNKTDNTYVDTGGTKYIVNDDGTVTSYGGTEIPNPITYDEIFDTDPWLNNNYYNFDPDA